MLSLPYNEFDQTYGSGFRELYDRGEYLKGAVLIEDYLKAHRELTVGEEKFLHLHAAQLFALAGKNRRAVEQLDMAVSHQKSPEIGLAWNDKLAETKAFLTHDRAGLLAAQERLAPAKSNEDLLANRLVENFGGSYEDALLWHRLCANVAVPKDASAKHQGAAEQLAKAFGFPVAVAETNPPACCIWIDLRPLAPNSSQKGYVIIHSGGGTLITATSQYWLDAAVKRFIKLSRQRNGYWEARFGLATSFDITR